jgi:uncharacterized protein
MPPPLLWSLHDVAPASFDRAERIVDALTAAGVRQIAILIIPSGTWSGDQLDSLRSWERDGHVLGAHGWTHRSLPPRGVYHRLHSALFSRDVAEHLSRPAADVRKIVAQGERWFGEAGLTPPRLYVPPAWAMGAMPLAAFHGTSFRWIETLTGIYDATNGRHRRLPLVGFEADTRFRAASLRVSNAANTALASAVRRPLRVAVHPNDFELLLSGDLRRLLASGRASCGLTNI